MVASYARGLGVPTLAYIDDGFNSEATSNSVPADGTGYQSKLEGYHRAKIFAKVAREVYFLHIGCTSSQTLYL